MNNTADRCKSLAKKVYIERKLFPSYISPFCSMEPYNAQFQFKIPLSGIRESARLDPNAPRKERAGV